MPLRNFLKLILPEQGVKIWTSIPKGGPVVNHFCDTFEELADQILANDALGIDTYHACATFATKQNRRAANAGWFKCLFVDVDVGEGKPYATVENAILACDEFCDGLSLPIPGMVKSGGGIHIYWPFDRILTREEWLPLACEFKLLMQARGFHADPSRTADAASILRSPGTHNYKTSPAREVTIEDIDLFLEPVSLSHITDLVINSPLVKTVHDINKPLNSAPFHATIPENASMAAGLPGSKAFNPNIGAKKGTRGSTQLKYAGELVAKGYSIEDVTALCMEWNKLCEPPQETKEVRRIVGSAFTMHAQKHPPVAPVDVAQAVQGLDMPHGFKWGNQGQVLGKVMVRQDDGSEKEDWKIVTYLPVYLSSWLNEEGYKKNYSYLFLHLHPKEGWQQFTMSTDDFNGPGWYGKISKLGISVADGMDKLFKSYVRRLEVMRRQTGITNTRFCQFGWKENRTQFLVGSDLCKSDGNVEQVVGNEIITPIMQAMPEKRGGSLESWTGHADGYGAPSLEAQLFMIQLSAAAPLMTFCVDEGNGGSVISFVTEKSGFGKTPGALAAASIWGEKSATVISGNTTDNRLIDDLTRRCHLPIIQEERTGGDPEYNMSLVKKLSAGVNRSRLSSGGTPSDIPETFQTLLITISNNSLFELVKKAPGGDAMSKRIFEIELERPDKHQLEIVGGLSREMMRNCGFAGRAIARAIVLPDMCKYINKHLGTDSNGKAGITVRKYWDILQTDPEHRFIVWPIACVDVMSTIMNHIGIMHFDVERQMKWIVKQAKFRIDDKTGTGIVYKLSRFLSEHVDSCLSVSGPYDPRKGPITIIRVPLRKIIMRFEKNSHRLYVSQEALQEWCAGTGTSYISMGKALKEAGVVKETSKLVTLGAGTEVQAGRALCWEIDTNHKELAGDEATVSLAVDNAKVVNLQ